MKHLLSDVELDEPFELGDEPLAMDLFVLDNNKENMKRGHFNKDGLFIENIPGEPISIGPYKSDGWVYLLDKDYYLTTATLDVIKYHHLDLEDKHIEELEKFTVWEDEMA